MTIGLMLVFLVVLAGKALADPTSDLADDSAVPLDNTPVVVEHENSVRS